MRKQPIINSTLKTYLLQNAGKKSLAQMYKETGRPPGTISHIANEMGISLGSDTRRELRNKVKAAIEEFHATKTATQIAARFGVDTAMVYYHAATMRIVLKSGRPKRQHPDDGKYFNPNQYRNWLFGD